MKHYKRPEIMGIINCTPDSFYANSRFLNASLAVKQAMHMITWGATIIDIGTESTRPGSKPVPVKIQIERISGVINAIRQKSSVTISIDTQSAIVAKEAIKAGANMINDISALQGDSNMAKLVASEKIPVVLMHIQSNPATMQVNPHYNNVVDEIREFFEKSVDYALKSGISKDKIILDPGIGFGKRLEDNINILRNINKLRIGEIPIMIGLSRKSFLGALLDNYDKNNLEQNPLIKESERMQFESFDKHQAEDNLAASLAAHIWCLEQQVDFLRVHDVRETSDIFVIWETLAWDS